MSADFGTQEEEDYLQVGNVKFPLPVTPPGQGGDWGSLHLAPMEPFSSSTVAGDDTLISDDRIAQQVWSDLRAGTGLYAYTESQSLSGYQDGDLDTTMPGVITLPPARHRVTDHDTTRVTTAPVYGVAGRPGGAIGWFLWSPRSGHATGYDTVGDDLLDYDFSLGEGRTINDILPLPLGYLIAVGGGGLYFVPHDDATPIAAWGKEILALAHHDGKVYGLGADGYMYWASESVAMGYASWVASPNEANQSAATFVPCSPDEQVTQMLEWRAADDARTLLVVTTERLVFYADADYFRQFVRHSKPAWPRAYVWERDDNLYVTNYPHNERVLVYDHQTIDEVGPNKGGGIQRNQRFAVASLGGHWRNMFAFCTDQQDGDGDPRGYPGRTMKATEAFGWCGLDRGTLADPDDWDSTVTDPIIGGFYGEEHAYTVRASGIVTMQDVPDEPALPYFLAAQDFDDGPCWLVSAETDASLEQIKKLAEWWRLNAILPDGRFGIPANTTLRFRYQVDGGAWQEVVNVVGALNRQVGLFLIRSNENTDSDWPLTVPLKAGALSQEGDAFYRLRWAIGLTGNAGFSPFVRSIALHYVRLAHVYDGLQVAVDLSVARFQHYKDGRFYGRDREDLLYELNKLRSGAAPYQWPVVIGTGGAETVYRAMDVRVSGDLDPSTGFGRWTFTLRDLTAPRSGR